MDCHAFLDLSQASRTPAVTRRRPRHSRHHLTSCHIEVGIGRYWRSCYGSAHRQNPSVRAVFGDEPSQASAAPSDDTAQSSVTNHPQRSMQDAHSEHAQSSDTSAQPQRAQHDDASGQHATSRYEVRAVPKTPFQTGVGLITTAGATAALVPEGSSIGEKTIFMVRHGLSEWSQEGRIQGSSNESDLTEFGEWQAERCRRALQHIPFDVCWSSPITRAMRFAEVLWCGRGSAVRQLDCLKEANLGWLQGMTNAYAREHESETYRAWRETPATFCIDGRYPVLEVFEEAKDAWKTILLAEGSTHLVVTHKSILRALVCVALAMPASCFRATDVHNSGVCMFRVNRRGEAMLVHLNLTSHLHADDVFY